MPPFRSKPPLSPELEQRIRSLADALGVQHVKIEPAPARYGFQAAGLPPAPWGGYSPSQRRLELFIPPGATEATIETVALHELGHAATVPHTEERSRSKRLENAYGFISDETRAEEVAAWEWAAPRFSRATIPTAARLADVVLGPDSYDVAESERQRITSRIWSAADPSAARPQS